MMMFGLENPLDLAMVTWVVPSSDADREFPAHGHTVAYPA